MNYEKAAAHCKTFFETTLAPLGFVLRAQSFAERVLVGMRQIVVWKLENRGAESVFACDVLWAYSHEADDIFPNAGLGDDGRSLTGGGVNLIHATGVRSAREVADHLGSVRDKLLRLLSGTQSAAQVLAEVQDYLPAGRYLFGEKPMAMSLNYAYCTELAGMKAEAARQYQVLSQSRKANRSLLAIRCREAARKRAETLSAYLSDSGPGQCAADESHVDANRAGVGQRDASVEPLEAWLARRILPFGLPAQAVLPNRFTKAIERVYSPARGFWHSISAERFVDELERCDPAYLADIADEWSAAGCGSFRDDVINEIRTKQFDEYSATFLLSVPNLSDDDENVYDLLERHLRKAGEDTHLRYLELDGVKAIGHIRDMMDQLWEHAHPDCV